MLDARDYDLEVLENGLRLCRLERPGFQTVTLVAGLRGGPAYETPETNGVSHFLEHLHMAATLRHPAPQARSAAIDSLPGSATAWTALSSIHFAFHTAPEAQQAASELLVDALEQRTFDAERVDAERRIISHELGQYGAMHPLLGRLLRKHPYGLPVGGTSKSVARLKVADVVQMETAIFQPQNMVVTAAGDLSPDNFDHLRSLLAGLRPGNGQPLRAAGAPSQLRLPHVWVHPARGRQFHVALLFLMSRDLSPVERVATHFLHWRLAGYSAPFRNRMRHVDASLYEVMVEDWRWPQLSAFLVCANPPKRDRFRTVTAAMEELRKLRDASAISDWLELARRKMLFWMHCALDDLPGMATSICAAECDAIGKGAAVSLRASIELARAITPEQVADLGDQWLRAERCAAYCQAGSGLTFFQHRRLMRAIAGLG